MTRPAMRATALLLAALLAAAAGSGAAQDLTPLEEQGKRIFLEGKSPSGRPLFARIGRDLVKVPAGAVPCGGCHGPDGRGRPEGGVEPPDITWANLIKGYGHRHPDGRAHQPFDEGALASAIRARVDPAYNALNPAMPQFDLSDEEMTALIAYIKRLEGDLDPGLSAGAIRIGALAPGPGPMQAYGEAITATLRAYADELNAAGGVYGRRLEIVVAERAGNSAETLANLRRLVEDEPVFAMVASFAVGVERDVFDLLQRAGVPNVGPITLDPVAPGSGDAAAFLVVSGVVEQARALVGYAARRLGPAPGAIAVAHSSTPEAGAVVRAVAREARGRGLPEPLDVSFAETAADAERVAAELSRAGAGAVLYLGSDNGLKALAEHAAGIGWRPLVLLSGPLSARAAMDLPAGFAGEVALAYPNLPSDRSAEGVADLRRLGAAGGAETGHLATRISALVAVEVLVEGLRRAGRDVSRAKLVRALESLSKFDTGLTPPISFGPSRHVGARGAHIVAVDLERRAFATDPIWISLEDQAR